MLEEKIKENSKSKEELSKKIEMLEEDGKKKEEEFNKRISELEKILKKLNDERKMPMEKSKEKNEKDN